MTNEPFAEQFLREWIAAMDQISHAIVRPGDVIEIACPEHSEQQIASNDSCRLRLVPSTGDGELDQ